MATTVGRVSSTEIVAHAQAVQFRKDTDENASCTIPQRHCQAAQFCEDTEETVPACISNKHSASFNFLTVRTRIVLDAGFHLKTETHSNCLHGLKTQVAW